MKAPHTDVEELAAKLDQMVTAAKVLGIELHRVERAADMLRHLSEMVVGCEKQIAELSAKDTP